MLRAIRAFGAWLRTQFTPTEAVWKAATRSLLALTLVLVALNVAVSVVLDFTPQRFLGMVVTVLTPLVVALALFVALRIARSLRTSYLLAVLIAAPFAMMTGRTAWGAKGGLVFTGLAILSLSFFAGGLASLLSERLNLRRQWPMGLVLVAGMVGLIAIGYGLLQRPAGLNPAFADFVLEDRTLDLPDPGESGSHAYRTLTYGTGSDKHRPEYGADVDILTRSVDGSKLVDKWRGPVGWARTRYWGFDSSALPLQGHVWLPEGPGPFPLVLVVHGNHAMEVASDLGYTYLGEHLASHGFLVVSVDENFLNTSYADMLNPRDPGIGSEIDARAWVLLEHLVLWRDWMADASHELHGKADLAHIALIGHSRAGEAVAHAAAFNRLSHYPDDALLRFDYRFDIGAVIAIAPADGQYKPRNSLTLLEDVDYFTIHGSLDGDIRSFVGASQFSRLRFSDGDLHFKSSLYVDGANHGQFNSAWGRNDLGLPYGWFLDTRQIMDPEDQRRIARVYFTAFLETTLNERQAYRPLFRDPRAGAQWLPDTYYLANYEDTETKWVATFEEDLDPSSATWEGATIETRNLSRWKETRPSLKQSALDTHAALFGWDEAVGKELASFRISLGADAPRTDRENVLVFSAASESESVLDWTLVLADHEGQEARLPLSHDQPLYPQLVARTRRAGFLENVGVSEPLPRYYAFPLADFVAVNPDFDPSRLAEIRFEFDRSERGAILLDNVGLR